jgi:hypothetical protein
VGRRAGGIVTDTVLAEIRANTSAALSRVVDLRINSGGKAALADHLSLAIEVIDDHVRTAGQPVTEMGLAKELVRIDSMLGLSTSSEHPQTAIARKLLARYDIRERK